MPNWTNNTLEITHEDPAMIDRVLKAFKAGELLNEFLPCPPELKIVAGSVGGKESYAQQLLEATEVLNKKFFGHTNWYDWQVANWGTKWDVGGNDYNEPYRDNNFLSLSFDSAWSPPIAAYEAMMEMGFEIRAMYYEPGMCFAGIWENGDDDYYDLSGLNSDELEENLPVKLDQQFCISESMAEYEEENEEENK